MMLGAENKEHPLVSVVVVTYNSSAFVLETLDSIRDQDYPAIELIITDDCSPDHTVSLIERWCAEAANVAKFVRYKIVANQTNKGIAGNCNAGFQQSEGQWLKFIAGDDVLLPGCITGFMQAVQKYPAEQVFFSKLKWFMEDITRPVGLWPKLKLPSRLKQQYQAQLKGGFIKAPGVFLNSALLAANGGFDERYAFLEDDPMWLKLLGQGHRFQFVPEPLIGYRMHDKAISHSSDFINKLFFDSLKRFREDVILPLMWKRNMYVWYYLTRWELNIQRKVVEQGNHRDKMTFSQKLALKGILAYRLASKLMHSLTY